MCLLCVIDHNNPATTGWGTLYITGYHWQLVLKLSFSTLKMVLSCLNMSDIRLQYLYIVNIVLWPPLWSSGQSFWLQIQRSRARFPALPDFLSSSGSGTGSTQPREVNWGATWIKSSGSGSENRVTAVGIRCADHVTPLYPQKLALTSPTGGGRSVGIVRSRTKATEFFFLTSCFRLVQ